MGEVLPPTIVDATYFTRGHSHGRFEENVGYWREKTIQARYAHVEAAFRTIHMDRGIEFTDVQLLSFIAGYLVGFAEALAEMGEDEVRL